MSKATRPSLIERAAGRLDLRALTESSIPLAPAASGPVSNQATAESREAVSVTSIGDGRGAIIEASALLDRAGKRKLDFKTYDDTPLDGERVDLIAEKSLPQPVRFNRPRLHELALVDWAAGRTRAAEEFRIIKRQLLEQAADPARSGSHRNLIMITSARPREGRTFTALNLAISISMDRNWEVLLIDACDNENAVASVVPKASPPGWLDLLEDPPLGVSGAILQTDIPRLSLLLPGHRQDGNAEPLASGNMHRLLKELSRCNPNRVVLIDAPPCLDTSDPATLARVVGQTVLVVEAHTTQQQGVEAALELLRPCENTYLVLNKSRTG